MVDFEGPEKFVSYCRSLLLTISIIYNSPTNSVEREREKERDRQTERERKTERGRERKRDRQRDR